MTSNATRPSKIPKAFTISHKGNSKPCRLQASCDFGLLRFIIAAKYSHQSTKSSNELSHPSTTLKPLNSPLVASNGTCRVNCRVTTGKPAIAYSWWPYISYKTTITAATLVVLVNPVNNTTRTSWRFNELPSGYTLPPRNTNGTQVQTVYYTSFGTRLSTVMYSKLRKIHRSTNFLTTL